jgi:hypothetical protein
MIYGFETSWTVSACTSGKEKPLDRKEVKVIRTMHTVYVSCLKITTQISLFYAVYKTIRYLS